MPDILSPETIARLKQFAEPFVDTIDSVVNRAIDALVANTPADPDMKFEEGAYLDSGAPPNLTYTTVLFASIGGDMLPRAEHYWNLILVAALREARKNLEPEKIQKLVIGNSIVGMKEENGYKHLSDVGISVQGMDSNGAWRAAFHILRELNIPYAINFRWQDNPKAARPGEVGMFSSVRPNGGPILKRVA